MLTTILRDRWLIVCLGLALLIKLFSLNADWVERFYSNGFYPVISSLLRFLLGWIPFSMGDIFYFGAGLYLLVKFIKLLRLLFQRRLKAHLGLEVFLKYARAVLAVYILFNVFWGLNYNRKGIADQLGLDVRSYDAAELFKLTSALRDRVNYYAAQVDSLRRIRFDQNNVLFDQGIADYRNVKDHFGFLQYDFPSVKASLYGVSGKYFGYTGYYNPFSGEAQLKTSIPVFLKSFVLNHEIAHQLGYAKENEASFVSYLAGKNSSSIEVRYSVYYELFGDALRQFLRTKNHKEALPLFTQLHPLVLRDKLEELGYLKRNSNFIAPFMSGAYDRYLKLNNQPKGNATYDEVIAWLMAYVRKYGEAAL